MAGHSALNALRVALAVICALVLLVSLVLIAIAILVPNWLILDMTREHQMNMVGLWLHCYHGYRDADGHGDDTRWQCDLKGSMDKEQASDQTIFYFLNQQRPAHVVPLILLCCAFAVGVITLFIACCAFCRRWMSIAWSVGTLVTATLVLAAVIRFFVGTQTQEQRQVIGYGSRSVYYMGIGTMFWVAVAAGVALFIDFVLTIPVMLLTFKYERARRHDMNDWTYSEPLRAPISTISAGDRFRPDERAPLHHTEKTTIV